VCFCGVKKLREREKLKKFQWVHNNTREEQNKTEQNSVLGKWYLLVCGERR